MYSNYRIFILIPLLLILFLSGIAYRTFSVTASPNLSTMQDDDGSITGIVTNDAGESVENIYVKVYTNIDGVWSVGNSSYTDENGQYQISNLSPGTYRVGADAYTSLGYIDSYYDGSASLDEATDINVSSGQSVTADIQLITGGIITGLVVGTEEPSERATVAVYVADENESDGWRRVSDDRTDRDGQYQVGGLPTGTYRVMVTPYFDTDYVKAYYGGSNLDNASDINVSIGQTVTLDTIQLVTGGIIAGLVTGAEGPLRGAYVAVYIADENESDGWRYVKQELTDGDGQYQVGGLPTGTYRVMARPPSNSNYIDTYYGGSDLDDASDINVSTGETVTIDNIQMVTGGIITGQVTKNDEEPFYRVYVQAYIADADKPDGWRAVYIEPVDEEDGQYQITQLPAGTYRVGVHTPSDGEYLDAYYGGASIDEASDINISLGQTVMLDNIEITKGNSITGFITGDGESLFGATVKAFIADQDSSDGWRLVEDARTQFDGQYQITKLPAGTYRLEVVAPSNSDYFDAYYGGGASLDEASDINIPLETTTTIDIKLSKGGIIAGQITGDEEAWDRVTVRAYIADENEADGWRFVDLEFAYEDGQYRIDGLPAGIYYVIASPPDETDYLDSYYGGSTTLDEANKITVILDETTIADISLIVGGVLAGQILDSDGAAVANAPVSAYTLREDGIQLSGSTGTTSTDEAGNYRFSGLIPGSYWVTAQEEQGGLSSYYGGATDIYNAESVAVLASQTATADVNLVEAGSISGRVTDSSGQPLADIDVSIDSYGPNHLCQADSSVNTQTDNDGYYTIPNLQSGNYNIRIGGGQYVSSVIKNVVVTLGNDTSGVDAMTRQGGSITGTVTDPDGESVDDSEGIAELYHYDLTTERWQYLTESTTVSTGRYRINGLAAGIYRIRFKYSGEQSYASQFYGGSFDVEDADDISVVEGEITRNINMTLSVGGQISGQFLDLEGNPTGPGRNVSAQIYRYASEQQEWNFEDTVDDIISDDGYMISGLAPGTYRLYFRLPGYPYTPPGGGTIMIGDSNDTYYPGPYVSLIENASDINVTEGETTSMVDVTIVSPLRGRIFGRVADLTNSFDRECIDIYAYRYDAESDSWLKELHTSPSDVGNFSFEARPGTYRLQIEDESQIHATEYYDGQADITSATDVLVPDTGSDVSVAVQLAENPNPPTPAPTNTPIPTETPMPTPTATAEPTNTEIPATETATATATATMSPTDTPVPPTATDVPPTATVEPTAMPTDTEVPVTATATSTDVPPTATIEPTVMPTETPVPATATSTEVPPAATAEPTVMPTDTDVPDTAPATEIPTETPVPATATDVPATATTEPTVMPTETPVPAITTDVPPVATAEPTVTPTVIPTSTDVPATAEPQPTATVVTTGGVRLLIEEGDELNPGAEVSLVVRLDDMNLDSTEFAYVVFEFDPPDWVFSSFSMEKSTDNTLVFFDVPETVQAASTEQGERTPCTVTSTQCALAFNELDTETQQDFVDNGIRVETTIDGNVEEGKTLNVGATLNDEAFNIASGDESVIGQTEVDAQLTVGVPLSEQGMPTISLTPTSLDESEEPVKRLFLPLIIR